MKSTFKKLGLAIAVIALGTSAFGQKAKVTSAAVEFNNNFMPAFQKQNMEGAKKSILIAKEFIDEAAQHPDTKDDQKQLWYRGKIYGGLVFMLAMDSTLTDLSVEDALEESIVSLERGHGLGKKYKADIEETASNSYMLFFASANMAFEKEMFKDAAEGYDYASRYMLAIDKPDTNAISNAALCYEKASENAMAGEKYAQLFEYVANGVIAARKSSENFRTAKELDKAKAIITKARAKYPTNKELLIELVNINLDAGDSAGAEKALSDAIASDPTNVQLYYTIGTIYIDLKENQKAEDALRKALELSPGNPDVLYQLGAHLYNWANELKLEANKMDKNDPREQEVLKQSEDKMNGAVETLEQYLEKDPNNKAILDILYRAYYKSGNNEKAMEYKKRHDAL